VVQRDDAAEGDNCADDSETLARVQQHLANADRTHKNGTAVIEGPATERQKLALKGAALRGQGRQGLTATGEIRDAAALQLGS
jgi:hypothetical protein